MKARVIVTGADQVEGGLKRVRRDLNQMVKTDMRESAENIGLPVARRLERSGRISQIMRAGATTRDAYLEIPKRSGLFPGDSAGAVALLQFGGVRRDPIRPKRGRAVKTPYGPRAAVTGPRRYKGSRSLSRAVKQTLPLVLADLDRRIAKGYEDRKVDVG
ncbi:MAG: hypothetical protein ACKVWR_21900 [Acidimicrobiales bacterium]